MPHETSQVTDAKPETILRVLAKLEHDWPVKKPITEYAAAIDPANGRLSAMTRRRICLCRSRITFKAGARACR